MKKIIAALVACVMVLSGVACAEEHKVMDDDIIASVILENESVLESGVSYEKLETAMGEDRADGHYIIFDITDDIWTVLVYDGFKDECHCFNVQYPTMTNLSALIAIFSAFSTYSTEDTNLVVSAEETLTYQNTEENRETIVGVMLLYVSYLAEEGMIE